MSNGVMVEVEVDEADILLAGYHHVTACPAYEQGCSDGCEDFRRLSIALKAMHEAHHDGPFRLCREDPCRDMA